MSDGFASSSRCISQGPRKKGGKTTRALITSSIFYCQMQKFHGRR